MSRSLILTTPFDDISALAEGLQGRVTPERLILYAAEAYAPGEEIAFEVNLADGSAGLRGQAVIESSHDAWEEQSPDARPEEMRFDVVLVGMQYDPMSEIYRDRILQLETPGERHTGEVRLPDDGEADVGPSLDEAADEALGLASEEHALEADVSDVMDGPAGPDLAGDWEPDGAELAADVADVSDDDAWDAADDYAADGLADDAHDVSDGDGYSLEEQDGDGDWHAPPASEWPQQGTETVDLDAFQQASPFGDAAAFEDAAAAQPDVVYDNVIPLTPRGLRPAEGAPLLRPSRAASWFPSALAAPVPMQANPAFAHLATAFVLPTAPPRPDLEPQFRITPAPRPGAAGPVAFSEGAVAYAAAPAQDIDLAPAATYGDSAAVPLETQVGVSTFDDEAGAEPGFDQTAAFDYASSDLAAELGDLPLGGGEVTIGDGVEIGEGVQFPDNAEVFGQRGDDDHAPVPEDMGTLSGMGDPSEGQWNETAVIESPEHRDDSDYDDPDYDDDEERH